MEKTKPTEHEKRLTIDGQDVTQIRYSVRSQTELPGQAQTADLRFFKGRNEIAAYEGLTREELQKAVGADNLAAIEATTGIQKRGQQRDEQGHLVAYSGKLEKDQIKAEAISSDTFAHKKQQAQTGELPVSTAMKEAGKDDPVKAGLEVFAPVAAERLEQGKGDTKLGLVRESAGIVVEATHLINPNDPKASIEEIKDRVNDLREGRLPESIQNAVDAQQQEPNSIEPDYAPEQTIDDEVRENVARMWAKKRTTEEVSHPVEGVAPKEIKDAGDNEVENDDVFADLSKKNTPPEPLHRVPPEVESAYLRVGNKFHYANKPELPAFEDRGNKLETTSNGERVAADLVKIAEARGWTDIKVRGTDEFKRQVWLEAQLHGLGVKGYKPTEADQALLEAKRRERPANAVENDSKAEQAKPTPAKAADQEKPAPQQKTEQAKPEPAKPAPAKEKNEWEKRADALRDMPQKDAVKKYPDLVNAYAVIRAAEIVARNRIHGEGDRKQFVDMARESIARQIETNRAVPDVKIKDQVRQQERDTQREQAR